MRFWAALITTVIMVVLPVGRAGATAAGSSIELSFGLQQHPAATADMTLHIVYRSPSDPDAKPPAIRHLRIDAPAGTRFDTAAVPVCTASNVELQTIGRTACPAASQVGAGTLTVIEGFGPPIDPIDADAVIFNGGTGIIETFTAHGSVAPVIAIDRIAVSGSTLTGNPPANPGGPPDGQTAVRDINFSFPAATGFITTPPTCPPDGAWSTAATFMFADGTTQAASSTTPCAAGASSVGSEAQPMPAPTPTLPETGQRPPVVLAVGALTIVLGVRPALRLCRRDV